MRQGFSLVELVVVVAVIGILAALIVPGYRSASGRAQSIQCLANLRGIGVALNGWLAEHDMRMPPLAAARASLTEDVPVLDNTLDVYAGDVRVFTCPADQKLARETGTSYFWNSTLSGQSAANLNFLAFVTDLSRIPVVVDKEGWHVHSKDKVNHLFADGHVANQLRLFSDP